MTDGIPCMLMRGGSSKGAYFLAADLPADTTARDQLLLQIMGSPDARQIDGIGGAHPLTSKVAVVSLSATADADVDYLFLQIGVDEPLVSDQQNCGNLLAGVAPFAVDRGLVVVVDSDHTDWVTVRIKMLNTGSIATAQLHVRNGRPVYEGTTAISGVPGTAAPIALEFQDIAGSSTGALLPSGNRVDVIEGIDCTLIDNGMPVVVMAAEHLGVSGYEDCSELEANADLCARLEAIRLEAGRRMGLGDVSATTVPKLTLVAPALAGGDISTRTFIPHRCHDAIGVLGAVSVATAALLPGTPANRMLGAVDGDVIRLEHPTGVFEAVVELVVSQSGEISTSRAGIIRTARKLMDGIVFPRSD